MDTKNNYFAYFDTFAKVQGIMVNRNDVVIVGGINAGERLTYVLH